MGEHLIGKKIRLNSVSWNSYYFIPEKIENGLFLGKLYQNGIKVNGTEQQYSVKMNSYKWIVLDKPKSHLPEFL